MNTASLLTTSPNEESQLVTFILGDEFYGLPIKDIQEIIRMTEIVKIPKSPPFVEGVINLRGRILPIIDLRKRFDVEIKQDNLHSRIIVVEISGVYAGIIVDGVREVMNMEGLAVDTPPKVFHTEAQRFLSGIVNRGDHMIMILDIRRLLSSDEYRILEDSAEA